MKIKNIYISMFRALDCLYSERPSDELGEFLGDANPYLFEDHSSADPAVEYEFNQFASEYLAKTSLTMESSYDMVLNYLEINTTFAARFKEIDLEEWTSLYNIVSEEESLPVKSDSLSS